MERLSQILSALPGAPMNSRQNRQGDQTAGLKFKARHRIKTKDNFRRLFAEGKFIRGRLFSLWVLKDQNDGPKIGIIVSKKTSKKATERNLWKRRIREVFRQHTNQIDRNSWIMIKARQLERIPSYEEINAEFKTKMKSANILFEKEKT